MKWKSLLTLFLLLVLVGCTSSAQNNVTTKKRVHGILLAIITIFILGFVYVNNVNHKKNEVKTWTESDRPSFNDIKTLTSESDAVFIGEVQNINGTRNLARNPQDPSKEDENIYVEGVDYKVNVLEFLKGNDSNQIVLTEQKLFRFEKDNPLTVDERYIGLNPKSIYVFFAKKSSTTGSYYAVGDPFFFEIKNNRVRLLTNEQSLREKFKDKGLVEFKQNVKEMK